MKKDHVIILAARNQLSHSDYNSQLSPIHGKPALFWTLDLYYKEHDVSVIINEKNKILQNLIQISYPNAECVIVRQNEMYKKHGQFSVLTSLFEGLAKLHSEKDSVTVVLGDTYCVPKNYDSNDYILTAMGNGASEKWCLAATDSDGTLLRFYDKETGIDTKDKRIVTGMYHFSDVSVLRKCAVQQIKAKKSNLSDLVAAYNQKIKVRCIQDDSWLDFGHRAGVLKAQRHFYNSRNFNSISVSDVTNVLTKRSVKKEKLSDEYDWYKNVPEDLQSFVPRVYGKRETEELFEIDMENYGYPPLSELWLYGDYEVELWQLIIKKLVDVRLYMNQFEGNLAKENYEQLYVAKFFSRLEELKNSGEWWEQLLSQKSIMVNGTEYKNLPEFGGKLEVAFKNIAASAKTSVMHGDYCFSNILFDTQNFICKLIDPRGRLLEETIYGDSRYDLAKLRHSLAGNYDFIVHGLYRFSEQDGKFSYEDGCQEDRTPLAQYFDSLLIQNGYDINEIKLIEASLFLSMIPLHTDSFEQQKIFYIKGIQKLNECFEKSGEEK